MNTEEHKGNAAENSDRGAMLLHKTRKQNLSGDQALNLNPLDRIR